MSPRPLNATALHILLVLGERRLHGYAMMEELERRTHGALTLLPGSLYTNLARLVEEGLVREAPPPPYERQGAPRRYYERTPEGRAAAECEARRIDAVAALARAEGLLDGGEPS
ncbi:MAG: PadR family transcriptional regulator [Rhodothermales bacterium]|nr:PadR family transcriptional regulator [Rhodothermales bacterium]